MVGGYLNRVLAPLGTRLGPDPASIDACMIGGIVANNSSGMCCGVAQNSYHTLDALHFMLADGTVVDTARPEADDDLRRARPDLHAAPPRPARRGARGRDAGRAHPRPSSRASRPSAYALNALLDHDTPVQILAHLMVGSQGTLGFMADVTLRTVPEPPHRATALLYFAELAEAGAAVAPLVAAGAAALEIMDAASLRSQAGDREYPFAIGDAHGGAPRRVPRRRRGGPGRARSRRAEEVLAALPPARPRRRSRPNPPSATGTGTCARGSSRRWGTSGPPARPSSSRTWWCRWSAWPRPSPTSRSSTPSTASRTPSPSATRATATCTSCSPRTSPTPPTVRRYAAFMRELVDAGGGEIRRRPQGRARVRAATWRPSCATNGATAPTRSCSGSRPCSIPTASSIPAWS